MTIVSRNSTALSCFSRAFAWLTGLMLGAAVTGSANEPTPSLRLTPKNHPGAKVYEQQCVKCHGADGQGVKEEYNEPLAGSRSIESLARRIERTMPEDEPKTCIGEDAKQVADFVYHEFYSPEARRKKGLLPRIELTRFTVPQYRNAVADLLLHFTPTQAPPREGRGRGLGRRDRRPPEQPKKAPEPSPGLRAQYYQSKGMSKADGLRLERIDSRLEFDFGKGSPVKDITADQFAVVWDGTLIAKQTGYYEFRLHTQNGARLYVNGENTGQRRRLRDDSSLAGQTALIDAWVSSGKMRQIKSRLFLLGGRQYPFRLEFFKYKEANASIKLEWKQPEGAWSVLDGNFLTTAESRRTFVVDAPFPADDRSLGYERGSSISSTWHAAAIKAAVNTATEVINRLPLLAELKENTPDRDKALKRFVTRFGRVAFRRPLTKSEEELLGGTLFTESSNAEAAVRRAIILILSSPSFLYTDLTPADRAPDQYAVANRLSLALWDSIPDSILLDAASKGELGTADQVAAQARRMKADPRTHDKVQRFFKHWLELEDRDLAKDRKLFPEFTDAVVNDLRHSLDLFLEQVVWSDDSDYRQLLLSHSLMLTPSLREIYQPKGTEPKAASNNSNQVEKFEPVAFQPDRRAGLLTHPYLLSVFAYHNNSSPIHRGVFLTRNIVGRDLRPPPIAVAFKDNEFAPDATMREKITELTRDKACMSCHSVINPLGFALENFDAVGRWRTKDKDKPIDPKSEYVTEEGDTLQVDSARDIAEFAVTSPLAHRAFVVQLFQHLIKQAPAAYGWDAIDQLTKEFGQDNFNIQNLIVDIAVRSARYSPSKTDNAKTPSEP